MATLTYDPTPAGQPEFNEAEQEALAIGEAAAEEQQRLLAGKFKDAESLEKAYVELQSKLGSRNNEDQSNEADYTDNEQDDVEVEESASILDALWEDAQTGKLSAETRDQLSKMNPAQVAAEYLKYRQQVEDYQQSNEDISDTQVAELRGIVGGDEAYQEMISWASENLSPEDIQRYDNVIASGNYDSISFAIEALKSKYTEAMGVEGQLFKGKPASNSKDVFRSQAEVVQAMSDPRYDRDPAYRSDVFEKLERSDLQY
jgi:hypothetical protein